MWSSAFRSIGSITEPCDDDGVAAHRVFHVGSDAALRMKFSRAADAMTAAKILSREMPIDTTDRFEVANSLRSRYGTIDVLRKKLLTECCGW